MSNMNESDFACTIFSEDVGLTENRKNIIELFSGYNDEYASIEIYWGEPVGKERWYCE